LYTKYIVDQFVNIVKTHARNQTNKNLTINAATNVGEELNNLNKNSDTKNLGIQHIKANLRESLKEKWKAK
jgi:hypothetical protein